MTRHAARSISYQQSRYPAESRTKIETIHDGVDTRVVKPDCSRAVRRGLRRRGFQFPRQ
ncbi:hypothetical protein [Caballeronia mineralivorans]|uniref:hypothetical protein n=1 Tax=Caballeronia mineralivorans TaxID=2010198 RepID=UPI003A598E3C